MKEFKKTRRDFLMTTGKAGLAAGIAATVLPSWACATGKAAMVRYPEEIPFEQQQLPYSYNALETAIDAMTMEIHYSKHAAAYAKNLADAVKTEGVDTSREKLSALLGKISKYSVKMRNNGGGHYNHEFFWKSMKSPLLMNASAGTLNEALIRDFNSIEAFKTQFSDAGKNRFGSGWAWLCVHKGGQVEICSTPNQDNPLMPDTGCGGTPILGLDVWEHAYYIDYRNKRPDYIKNFMELLDWNVIGDRYDEALKR